MAIVYLSALRDKEIADSVKRGTSGMKETTSIVIDFGEKTISKIAFAKTREEAERIEQELGMHIYLPSDLADFEDKEPIFVLLDC